MRFLPTSIRGRLLASALVFTLAALLLAGLSIGEQFDRYARRGLEERLDARSELLARSVRADGTIDRALLGDIDRLIGRRHGWDWAIVTPVERTRRANPLDPGAERTVRTLAVPTSRGAAEVRVSAPRAVGDGFRRAAILPWAVSLAALAGFLLIATLLQLRIGLAPLVKLRAALAGVRAGKLARVPQDQPVELREMAAELNGLLDENEAALERARGHVANLAHSLKTPLATLSLKLRDGVGDPSGELTGLVAQIEGSIRHHLGGARAASPGAPGQLAVEFAPAAKALVDLLARIHGERGLTHEVAAPDGLRVKCDPRDLDEMLGNLLDNAFKCAATKVAISASATGTSVAIVIDDDGPGLTDVQIETAMARGRRLDERGDGHGFGLPIARELAELHGGELVLARSPLGGLRAALTLPKG